MTQAAKAFQTDSPRTSIYAFQPIDCPRWRWSAEVNYREERAQYTGWALTISDAILLAESWASAAATRLQAVARLRTQAQSR